MPRLPLSQSLVLAAFVLVVPEAAAQQPRPQPTAQQQAQQRQPARRRGDRSRLTRADLDEAGNSIVTARDAIRILRPHWLQPPVGRSASSNVAGSGGGATTVIVYLDGFRQPDLEVLNTVQASAIIEMRYLDQNRAIIIHGPGHEAGVIEIKTKEEPKKP